MEWMKNKRGFTLVELLAVIVILGIILLIAVPKIMDTIDSATDASMESSAKMLAASAEREYTVRQTLSDATAITCSAVATLSASDYDLSSGTAASECTISFDASGNATVQLCGASGGKFDGKCICGGTRLAATVTEASACA